MGIDTGAFKDYAITDENKVYYDVDFYDIEGEPFEYPNGEFVELARTIERLSKGMIDLNKYLIFDNVDYETEDHNSLIKQLINFSFEKAIEEGKKAREFLDERYEDVKKEYVYVFEPREVLDYLIMLWEKGYYVDFSY